MVHDNDNDFRARAACRGMDPELWFPAGEGKGLQPQIAKAKAVCVFCPVKDECLRESLAMGDADGIFGGTTPAERRAILKARKAAREQQAAELVAS